MSGDGSGSSLPSEVRAQSSTRSLESLMNLELVWNRQRGGRGSLTVGEVMDALAGPQSQVSCSYWWEQKNACFSRKVHLSHMPFVGLGTSSVYVETPFFFLRRYR